MFNTTLNFQAIFTGLYGSNAICHAGKYFFSSHRFGSEKNRHGYCGTVIKRGRSCYVCAGDYIGLYLFRVWKRMLFYEFLVHFMRKANYLFLPWVVFYTRLQSRPAACQGHWDNAYLLSITNCTKIRFWMLTQEEERQQIGLDRSFFGCVA